MSRTPRSPLGAEPQARTAERRNWRTRVRLDLLSRSGGPVRYWPVALFVALVLAGIGVWRATHARPTTPVIAYSDLTRVIAAGQARQLLVDGVARASWRASAPASSWATGWWTA
jgi:hypothetical protein